MKVYSLIFAFTVVLFSCSVKQEPLTMGKDACYTCKMTLMDKKFGGEIVTKKGKVYKFDDLSCMINFDNSGYEPTENVAYRLVVDYAHPENLINAKQTFYSKSKDIKSPMAGEAAAFGEKEEVEKFNAVWQGTIITWDELVKQSR